MKQLFGYTAPTASVGMTPFLQLFESPDAGRQVIRVRAGTGAETRLSFDAENRVALARALLSGLPGYGVRYIEPTKDDEYACGCRRGACICDFS